MSSIVIISKMLVVLKGSKSMKGIKKRNKSEISLLIISRTEKADYFICAAIQELGKHLLLISFFKR